jgi:predicted secreted protein
VAVVVTCDQFATQPDQTAAVEVARDVPFAVTLCSNPSMATYAWADPLVADPAIVKPDGAVDDDPASPIPGVPGERIFTFSGIAAGETTIAYGYAGPAPSAAAEWTLELTVTVV